MTKTRLILHAGGPKTGSSSIQECFSPMQSNLPIDLIGKLGFRLITHQKTSNLSIITDDLQLRRHSLDEYGLLVQDVKEQIKQGELQGDTTFVFSSEHAGRPNLKFSEAAQMRKFLGLLAVDSEVLYYLRPLISFATAYYVQILKECALYPRFGFEILSSNDIAANRIIHFHHLYSRDRVNVVLFDPTRLFDTDIRIDFIQRITGEPVSRLLKEAVAASEIFNSSISLQLYNILFGLYLEAGLAEPKRPPLSFVNFIDSGKWPGDSITLNDIFDEHQCAFIADQAISEYDSCSYLGIDMPCPGKQGPYARRKVEEQEILEYNFVLTQRQREVLEDLMTRLISHPDKAIARTNQISFIEKMVNSHPLEVYPCLETLRGVLYICMSI